MAPSLRVEVIAVNVREPGEIEHTVAEFARSPNGGLITPEALGPRLISGIALADRHKLPAAYYERSAVPADGLMSTAPNSIDQYRRAAGYVDRILKGEKLADLPVQAPTKYELVINIKTATTLGLTVPPTLLPHAHE